MQYFKVRKKILLWFEVEFRDVEFIACRLIERDKEGVSDSQLDLRFTIIDFIKLSDFTNEEEGGGGASQLKKQGEIETAAVSSLTAEVQSRDSRLTLDSNCR